MKLELIIWIVIFVDVCTGEKIAQWSKWTDVTSCTKTCGTGTKIQTRHCIFPSTKGRLSEECLGPFTQDITCNTKTCAVNGNWGAWTDSSTCTQTCGGGIKTQARLCNNPSTANGGTNCPGSASKTLTCNINLCPVYSKVIVAVGTGGTDVEIIDLLSTNTTCQNLANFPYASSWPSGALGYQNKPLICGGYPNFLAACHFYENGTWKSFDSLIQGRFGFTMTNSPFQDGSSKLFITGGNAGAISPPTFLSSSEVLTANGWQVSVPLPVTISYHCMVTINSTSVMAIGGVQNGQYSASTFLFNSVSNVWTQGPTMKEQRINHQCGHIRMNNQTQDTSLITIGGSNAASVILSSVEVLDLASNAWRSVSSLPYPITHSAVVEDPTGGVVLIGGFGAGIGNLNALYRLPHAGSDATWILMTQKLKTARYGHTAFLIPDRLANCNKSGNYI